MSVWRATASHPRAIALAFLGMWWVLGVAILLWTVATVHGALAAGHPGSHHAAFHTALLGAFEAVAALLFLVPRTMRIGAAGLLLTFAAALVIHGLEHQLRGDLVVYAAAVLYIALHGPVSMSRMRG